MLPDRSKRYAGVDGDIPRLVLAANWHLVLIALLVLALLSAIFPRKALVEKLYQQQVLDELTLSYVQNLYRANPNNADAALLLARSQQAVMSLDAMEAILWRLSTDGELRQRIEARQMLLNAYLKGLDDEPSRDQKIKLTARLIELMQYARQDDLPEDLAKTFATKAFELNLPQLGLVFFNKIHADQPELVLEKYGDLALAEGRYKAAAELYFLAQEKTVQTDDVRRLFMQGIKTLMAGSLFEQAMSEARARGAALDNDPVTLRFLSHTALAAGDTALAAECARKLVFQRGVVP